MTGYNYHPIQPGKYRQARQCVISLGSNGEKRITN